MWLVIATTPHLWADLAIDGWVMPPPSLMLEQSSTAPRVSSSFSQYEPLVGRATRIRQQLLQVMMVHHS